MFDSDRVYLELEGVVAEITMTGNMERAPGTVLLRLPVATSKQLCLVPKSWESPSAPELAERLARSGEASTRLAKLGGSQPRMKGASGRRQDPDNTPASQHEEYVSGVGPLKPSLLLQQREWGKRTMREELSNILRKRYPFIFAVSPVAADTTDAMPTVFSLWGFECGDGWFDLIDVLCAGLQLATTHGAPQVVAAQVKEKFGTLRFSGSGADARQRAMIDLAEMMSGRLCEICGRPGQTISSDWMQTRCPDHSTNS